jgi:hypothetical protein
MRVICIKQIDSKDSRYRTLRIKLGEWIDVTEKSRNDYSEDSKAFLKTRYFFVREETEYALDRKDFLSIEEWRDKQLNELL